MMFFLAGLLSLVAVLWAIEAFMRANPAVLAGRMRLAAGWGCFVAAALMVTRGLIGPAGILAAAGAWILGWQRNVFNWPLPKAPGQTSQISTEHLEMELDHKTGALSGRVMKGMFRGRSIQSLRPVELAHLWADCRFVDPQSARVIEAYLDRVHPTWREDMERGEREMASGPDGRMGPEEAYEILGLKPGATGDDIRTAHRELMKKMHPDRGGSTYLASKINEAKDVLLDQI
jgi:DnaJ domain